MLGLKLQSSARVVSALNHGDIFPALVRYVHNVIEKATNCSMYIRISVAFKKHNLKKISMHLAFAL